MCLLCVYLYIAHTVGPQFPQVSHLSFNQPWIENIQIKILRSLKHSKLVWFSASRLGRRIDGFSPLAACTARYCEIQSLGESLQVKSYVLSA